MKLKSNWLIFSAVVLLAALWLVGSYLLPVAIGGGVLLVLLIFSIRLDWGLYILAFSLPLINWNFTWNSLSVSFVEIIALLLVVAFVLHHSYSFCRGQNIWRKIKLPLWQPFLIFIIAAAISSLFSHYILFRNILYFTIIILY